MMKFRIEKLRRVASESKRINEIQDEGKRLIEIMTLLLRLAVLEPEDQARDEG